MGIQAMHTATGFYSTSCENWTTERFLPMRLKDLQLPILHKQGAIPDTIPPTNLLLSLLPAPQLDVKRTI